MGPPQEPSSQRDCIRCKARYNEASSVSPASPRLAASLELEQEHKRAPREQPKSAMFQSRKPISSYHANSKSNPDEQLYTKNTPLVMINRIHQRGETGANGGERSMRRMWRMTLPLCILSLSVATLSLAYHPALASELAPDSSASVSKQQNLKQSPNERSDQSASQAAPTEAVPKSEQSIVASLSSAVASAAAAAAVAAAQAHSLSGSDARSLAAQNHHSHQAHRSPGIHLAIKLADSIPEVPYNILHNMKKLDHAAPFYNVPNKVSGSSKESSISSGSPGGLLGSALMSVAQSAAGSGGHHASRLGGAAVEQLGQLFRSPLWKRLADGYDGFASEFRSMFRAPRAPSAAAGNAPMKASSGSTSTGKLLRDISVPALLMLLASSVSGAEWRPVRTRRKSLAAPTVDLPMGLALSGGGASPQAETMLTSASNSMQRPLFAPELASLNGFDSLMQQQARSNSDINLQQAQVEKAYAANWMPPTQALHEGPLILQQQPTNGRINHNSDAPNLSPSQQQQQQQHPSVHYNHQASFQHVQPPMRRLGEYIVADEQRQIEKRSDSSSPLLVATGSLTSLASQAAADAQQQSSQLYHERQAGKLLSLYSRLFREHANSRASSEPSYSLLSSAGSSPAQQQQNEQTFVAKQLSNAKRLIASAITSGSASSINFEDATSAMAQKRTLSALGNGPEQRDLTKLLPESWREVVKRTMSTVQQQANAQWKVVEGQLANWVQDKLKTVAAASAAAGSSQNSAGAASPVSTGGSSNASSPTAMSNIIASVSSSALNILGLNNNNKNSPVGTQAASVSTDRSSSSLEAGPSGGSGGAPPAAASPTSQRGKPSDKRPQKPASGAQPTRTLAGVANMLVQTIRSPPSSPSSSSNPSNPKKADDSWPPQSVASHYPTMTGSQASERPSSTSSTTSTTTAPAPTALADKR